ncbi:MAG: type II secretion system F family protein, partial [Ruthenibacterium sp.]
MKYQYTAVDARGKYKRGKIEAESENDAVSQLREERLTPTELCLAGALINGRDANGKATSNIFEVEIFERDMHRIKFPVKKLVVLFTQMAIMLRAGVSLSLALEVLAGSEANKRLRKVLGELHADLLGGVALSDAMAKFA